MKPLIVLLLFVAIHSSPCKSDEFKFINDMCTNCKYSYCKTCDGSGNCVDCPDGFTGTKCSDCIDNDKIIFRGKCVPCSEISSDPNTVRDIGASCTASMESYCKPGTLYDPDKYCWPCDYLAKNCLTCEYTDDPSALPICTKCAGNLVYEDLVCKEKSSASMISYGLFSIIILLTLIL